MDEYLVKCECTRCACVDESLFFISGQHIKQVCANCGAYIKFCSQNKLPSLKELRDYIWALCGKNKNRALHYAKKHQFKSGLPAHKQWVEYWRIYLKMREGICLKKH